MTQRVDGGRRSGIDRVWTLVAEGYRIVDVDSDDCFVGIRLEREGKSLTLLLTREDFVVAFPNAELTLYSVDGPTKDGANVDATNAEDTTRADVRKRH